MSEDDRSKQPKTQKAFETQSRSRCAREQDLGLPTIAKLAGWSKETMCS